MWFAADSSSRFLLCRTLTNGRSAMLTAMFQSDIPLARTAEDRAFIDRSGQRFGTVLDFLRTGACPELPTSRHHLALLLEEAEFYQARRLLLLLVMLCYSSTLDDRCVALVRTRSPYCAAELTNQPDLAIQVARSVPMPPVRA